MRRDQVGRILLVENNSQYHNEQIIDQFTKQAIPFTQNAVRSLSMQLNDWSH